MRYRAKVDWFVGVSLLVGIAVPAFIAITQNLPWMSVASILAAALVFGVSFPQRYDTTDDALIIKSGLTTRVIRYEQIKGLKHTNDGRLAIDYGIGNLLISPQQLAELTADLVRHAPHLAGQS